MTEKEYKAEITGPFDSILFKYRIEYFYRGINGRWIEVGGNWGDIEGACTFKGAERIVKRKLSAWRKYDAAQANKVTIT